MRRHDLAALRTFTDTLVRQFSAASEGGAQQVGEVFRQIDHYARAMAWLEPAFDRREPTLFAEDAMCAEQLTPGESRLAERSALAGADAASRCS